MESAWGGIPGSDLVIVVAPLGPPFWPKSFILQGFIRFLLNFEVKIGPRRAGLRPARRSQILDIKGGGLFPPREDSGRGQDLGEILDIKEGLLGGGISNSSDTS